MLVKSTPIVSVIVPTKNSAATLKKCLLSLKAQSYKSIEIIVIDNYSSDSTPQIARKYAEIFEQKGPERCTQRNYGVDLSHGTYVAIIDSDMYLTPSVIQEAVEAIQDKSIEGVIIPEESIGEGFWAHCKSLERSFYVGLPYMEAARLFRKQTFKSVGGYDENMISGEDWDLSQRIAKRGSLLHIGSFIHHDEGKISLLKTVRKKYYYAQHFQKYAKNSADQKLVKQQTSLLGRYKLFFSKPKIIAQHPILFTGMIYMKTVEFTFGGVGILVSKFRSGTTSA